MVSISSIMSNKMKMHCFIMVTFVCLFEALRHGQQFFSHYGIAS